MAHRQPGVLAHPAEEEDLIGNMCLDVTCMALHSMSAPKHVDALWTECAEPRQLLLIT